MDVRAALAALALVAATAASLPAQVSERRVLEAIDDAAGGIGASISHGSPLTGPAATLGGLGHVRAGVAAHLTRIDVLDPRRAQGTFDAHLPGGSAYAAAGILGGGGLGSLDVLGRVGVVTEGDAYDDLVPVATLGARLGLLADTPLTPAVSASVLATWLTELGFEDLDGDEVGFEADVRVTSLRLDVSKRLAVLTPYAGVGLDRTTIEARYRIPASASAAGVEIEGDLDAGTTEAKAYLGAALGRSPFATSLEVGRHAGGWFAALGLGVGI